MRGLIIILLLTQIVSVNAEISPNEFRGDTTLPYVDIYAVTMDFKHPETIDYIDDLFSIDSGKERIDVVIWFNFTGYSIFRFDNNSFNTVGQLFLIVNGISEILSNQHFAPITLHQGVNTISVLYSMVDQDSLAIINTYDTIDILLNSVSPTIAHFDLSTSITDGSLFLGSSVYYIDGKWNRVLPDYKSPNFTLDHNDSGILSPGESIHLEATTFTVGSRSMMNYTELKGDVLLFDASGIHSLDEGIFLRAGETRIGLFYLTPLGFWNDTPVDFDGFSTAPTLSGLTRMNASFDFVLYGQSSSFYILIATTSTDFVSLNTGSIAIFVCIVFLKRRDYR